jgi:hypothetical protein
MPDEMGALCVGLDRRGGAWDRLWWLVGRGSSVAGLTDTTFDDRFDGGVVSIRHRVDASGRGLP